jgi:anti-sigma factor RsiW
MNCSDVVSRFTTYLDGEASPEDVRAIERHLEGCGECVRYKVVLEHGAKVLRSLPEPEVSEDFSPRLRHRLYHVDDERVLSAHATSGASALTVLGIAILLSAVAWSPTLLGGVPVVELAPIVVDREPQRRGVPGMFSTTSDQDVGEGLWANTLLYDYSPLSQRYGPSRVHARRAESLGR